MEREKIDKRVVCSIALVLIFYVGLGTAAVRSGPEGMGEEWATEASVEALETDDGEEIGSAEGASGAAEQETGNAEGVSGEEPAGQAEFGRAEGVSGEDEQEPGGTEAAGQMEPGAAADVSDVEADAPGSAVRETDDDGVAPRVALTFDDGPHPVYTPQLLDGLKERGVKATFFVIGSNIPGREEILKRMDEEGHLIGNHTYDHVRIDTLSVEAACDQLVKTSDLVRAIIGKDTEYIRPPFGAWDKNMECGIPMFPVLWSVDTLDWTTENVREIVNRGIKDTHDGDIILMHDCYASSVEAALQITDLLLEQGYQFVTADQFILE
ncbi:MAG: polysaccharide deacetylase family protein [Eubacteriales bacterium]|nr:polysaccharide deacetylase family protein [Eubacteriales bacterium]